MEIDYSCLLLCIDRNEAVVAVELLETNYHARHFGIYGNRIRQGVFQQIVLEHLQGLSKFHMAYYQIGIDLSCIEGVHEEAFAVENQSLQELHPLVTVVGSDSAQFAVYAEIWPQGHLGHKPGRTETGRGSSPF